MMKQCNSEGRNIKKKRELVVGLLLVFGLLMSSSQIKTVEKEKYAEIEIKEIHILDENPKIVIKVKNMDSRDHKYHLKIDSMGCKFLKTEDRIQIGANASKEIPLELEIDTLKTLVSITVILEDDGIILDKKKILGNEKIFIEDKIANEGKLCSKMAFDPFEIEFSVFNITIENQNYEVSIFGDKFETIDHILSLSSGEKQTAKFTISPAVPGDSTLFITFSQNGKTLLSRSYAVTITDMEESNLPPEKSKSQLAFIKIKVIGLEIVLIIIFIMLLYHEKEGIKW